MSYSNRIFFYGPVGLLVLVVILYSVFWRVQADTLGARLDRANGGEITPGVVFAFAEKSIGGYPFRLDVVLSGVTFSHRDPEGETAWRSEKLALHALSYGRDRFIFEASGLQSFARPPLRMGGPPRVTYVTPAVARASAVFVEDKLTRFDADLYGVQAKEAEAGANVQDTFSADRAQLHVLARPGNNPADVIAEITNAKIGAGWTGSFELALTTARLTARITQVEALEGLRTGQMGIADAAAAWRKSRGLLAVRTMDVRWAKSSVTFNGALSLDDKGHVSGQLGGYAYAEGGPPADLAIIFRDGGIRFLADSKLVVSH